MLLNMNRMKRSRQPMIVGLAVLSILMSACGGSDAPAQQGSNDAQDSNNETQPAGDDADSAQDAGGVGNDAEDGGSGELVSGGVAEEILDGLPADGEESLGGAIGSLDAEQRFGISASQLEPEPKVEVNGKEIRFVFPGGSVDNALFDCIIGGALALDDETLTLVYPDGEKIC